MVDLQQFERRADGRWIVPGPVARVTNSSTLLGIGNVAEVPGHQEIDTVGGGDRDMSGIRPDFAWHCASLEEHRHQVFDIRVYGEKFNALERRETGVRGDWVACRRLCHNKL